MKVVILFSLIAAALACQDNVPSCKKVSKSQCQHWFLKENCKKYCGFCSENGHCGRPQIAKSRIVGGTVATPGSWPWQIGMYKNGRFSCGGSLVNNRWIVTAAHCIVRQTPQSITVRLGDHNRSSDEGTEQEIQVSRIVKHPDFRYGNNDIALLQLSKPVMFTKRIQPVCLPSQGENIADLSECFITGWGRTKYRGDSSNILKQLKMKVQFKSTCKRLNEKYFPITDKMICASSGVSSGESACQGDSGGPFVCKQTDGSYKLHGAVSWGSPKCSSSDAFTVFARVAEFRSWIDQYINN